MHTDYANDPRTPQARAYSATNETNSLFDSGIRHEDVDFSAGVFSLADTNIVAIERLRLVGCCREFPFWDVSYCYGRHADGRLVRVGLEIHQFNRNYKPQLVELCKRAGRYGKALGIFDAVSELRG